MKKVILGLLLLFPTLIWAQSGYRISGKFIGIKGGICNLVYQYGKQYPIADTAKIDTEGNFVFDGEKPLEKGVYLIAFPKKAVEVLVDKEQTFSIEVDTARIVETLKVIGSDETQLYYEHQRAMQGINVEFGKRLAEKGLTTADYQKPEFQAEWEQIQEDFTKYLKKFFRKNAGTLAVNMVKGYRDIDTPKLKKADGSIDSTAMYFYIKEHYFDNIELNDARLLFTPVVQQRVESFYKLMVYPAADSIIKESDRLMAKIKEPKVRKFVLMFLSKKYEIPPTLGHDGIYPHILEKYYINEPSLWDTSTVRIAEKIVGIQKPILMGKIVPDMVLQDTLNNSFSVHQIQAKYLVLFMYNPGCGHCKASAPVMLKFYEKQKDKGVVVVAASVFNEETSWRSFIKEYKLWPFLNGRDMLGVVDFEKYNLLQFPMIYVLDKDKKIVAKYMQAEQLDGLIESFEQEAADRAKKAEAKSGN